MRLITIPISHYCEKARWGLAYAGLDYQEQAHLQVLHYLAVLPHSRLGMVPVLLTANETICDSSEILRFADRHLADQNKLYPPESRAEVERLEDHYDEQLGVETRRWTYYHWLTEPAREVMRTAAQLTPKWQQLVGPIFFPLLRVFLNIKLGISTASVEAGLKIIESGFDDVAERLADGRPFLCGARFTAADLSFACMAAPVLLPPEYGVRLPRPEEAPVSARADIERFRRHPAGQFALRLFSDRRLRHGVSAKSR